MPPDKFITFKVIHPAILAIIKTKSKQARFLDAEIKMAIVKRYSFQIGIEPDTVFKHIAEFFKR